MAASAKKTKTTEKEAKTDPKTEESRGCPCMPSGEMPDCCGPGMKEMMSRFMGQLPAKEAKQG